MSGLFNATMLLNEIKDITVHQFCKESASYPTSKTYEVCNLMSNLHSKYNALLIEATTQAANLAVGNTSSTGTFVMGACLGGTLTAMWMFYRYKQLDRKVDRDIAQLVSKSEDGFPKIPVDGPIRELWDKTVGKNGKKQI